MAGQKGSKYFDIFLGYSVYLKNKSADKPVLHEEHFELLHKVDKLGSMAAAASEMGVSYRKAWELVRQSENTLGFMLLEKHRGGKDGGSSELTPDGKNLVNAYRELRGEFDTTINRIVKKFFQAINN